MTDKQKQKQFKESFKKINELDGITGYNYPETEDWMEFLLVFGKLLDSGLTSTEIESIIRNEIQ